MHMHRLLFSLALLGASTSTLAASASTVDNDATTQIDPDDCPGYDAQNVSWVGDTRLTADLVLRGPCALFGTGTGAGGKDHDVERLKLEVVVETRKFPPYIATPTAQNSQYHLALCDTHRCVVFPLLF